MEAWISLLGTLAALLLWWWRRRVARRTDPLEIHRQRYAHIDREIAATPHGRRGDAGRGLAADLDELERLSRAQGHPRRPDGDSP